MLDYKIRENLKDFLKELEHNKKINETLKMQNVIDIDYTIERIKDILQY